MVVYHLTIRKLLPVLADLKEKMDEQRAQMLAEVNAERSAHQKMVKEYARLEQRYANLEEELALERTDPNRIALDKSREIQAGLLTKNTYRKFSIKPLRGAY